jgi:uncharacterized protein YhfF
MMETNVLARQLALLDAKGIKLPPGRVRVDSFGDSAEMSQQLLALIVAGRKRGGACLLWTYEFENEALPEVGDIGIVVDHLEQPKIITRNAKVEITPFRDVTAEFAAREGEGEGAEAGTLAYWRREHWQYFTRECAYISREIDETMPVVCESFDVVEIVP